LKESSWWECNTRRNELGDFDKERMQLMPMDKSQLLLQIEDNFRGNFEKFQMLQQTKKINTIYLNPIFKQIKSRIRLIHNIGLGCIVGFDYRYLIDYLNQPSYF